MRARSYLPAVAALVAALVVPATAGAVVVEKVVAVVGEKAILQTDLRKRARPFLIQLYRKVPAGPQRAAADSTSLRRIRHARSQEQLGVAE